MTTGLVTYGSSGNSPIYYRRAWTGADGRLTVNAYQLDYTLHRIKAGKVSSAWPLSSFSNSGRTDFSANDTLNLYSKLREKAAASKLNLGVAVAESPETWKLLCSTAGRLAEGAIAVRRGRIDLACKALGSVRNPGLRNRNPSRMTSQDVSSMWLELQYGWLPLCGDAYEGWKLFTDRDKPRKYEVTASILKTWSGETSTSPSNYTAPGWQRATKRIVARLDELPDTSASLGLQDPEVIIWELVPFSFVADWFLPVSSYLENRAQIPRLKGSFTTTVKRTCHAEVNWSRKGTYASYEGCQGRWDAFHFDRSFSTTLTVPLPSFENPLEAISVGKRIANAAALLRSAFTPRAILPSADLSVLKKIALLK